LRDNKRSRHPLIGNFIEKARQEAHKEQQKH